MAILYHGSQTRGLKVLLPKQSSHGRFLYATPHLELALILANKIGYNYVYSLYKKDLNSPAVIIERLPDAFKTMFNNKASIYSISDETFSSINNGLLEVCSTEPVEIIEEIEVENVYERLKEFEEDGKIKIYEYPSRPQDFPQDNMDLLESSIASMKNDYSHIKNKLSPLLILHPELLEEMNNKMKEIDKNIEPFTKEDLIRIFKITRTKQKSLPNEEFFLDPIIKQLKTTYPEIVDKCLVEDNSLDILSILNLKKDKK